MQSITNRDKAAAYALKQLLAWAHEFNIAETDERRREAALYAKRYRKLFLDFSNAA